MLWLLSIQNLSTARKIIVVMNYSLVILKHFDLFGRTVKNQTVFKKKGISFQNKTIRRDELVVITLRLSTINTLLTSWLMKLWD
jgi:hypothetical protein